MLRVASANEGAKAGAQVKSNSSSMRLESIDGDRFKAEIEYKNEKGDSLKRSFEGTREEIQKQIDADKEMPEAIRNQLPATEEIALIINFIENSERGIIR